MEVGLLNAIRLFGDTRHIGAPRPLVRLTPALRGHNLAPYLHAHCTPKWGCSGIRKWMQTPLTISSNLSQAY